MLSALVDLSEDFMYFLRLLMNSRNRRISQSLKSCDIFPSFPLNFFWYWYPSTDAFATKIRKKYLATAYSSWLLQLMISYPLITLLRPASPHSLKLDLCFFEFVCWKSESGSMRVCHLLVGYLQYFKLANHLQQILIRRSANRFLNGVQFIFDLA